MTKKRSAKKTAPEATPTFEQAMQEAELIVRELEQGGVALNESLQEYERGIGLLARCFQHLEEAELRINQLAGFDESGQAILSEMDDAGELTLEQKARARSRRRTASRPRAAEDGNAGEAEIPAESEGKRRRKGPSPSPRENREDGNSVDETQGLF